MTKIIMIICSILLISPVLATNQLNLITYNVFGLPFPIKLKDKKRFKLIARSLNAISSDIVALQETFSKQSKSLAKLQNFPYLAYGNPPKKFQFIDSGLITLSKYPILRVKRLVFKACTGFDCFSRKGALLTTIKVPSIGEIDIYNTHLNAGKNKKVKYTQLEQLYKFIRKYSSNRPAVILGDFNITPDSDFYTYLMDSLPLTESYLEYARHNSNIDQNGYTYIKRSLVKKKIKSNRKLDYIFYLFSSGQFIYPEYSKIIYDGGHDENQYSDHFGVQTQLIIEN